MYVHALMLNYKTSNASEQAGLDHEVPKVRKHPSHFLRSTWTELIHRLGRSTPSLRMTAGGGEQKGKRHTERGGTRKRGDESKCDATPTLTMANSAHPSTRHAFGVTSLRMTVAAGSG